MPMWLADVAAPISAMAAVFTAAVAAWSLYGARTDSREQSRPLVVPALHSGPTFVDGFVYLVITNHGRTAAYDLNVSFTPSFDADAGQKNHMRDINASRIARRYKKPLELLAPGQRLINSYAYRAEEPSDEDEEASVDSPDAPDEFLVSIHYRDGQYRRPLRRLWRRTPRIYKGEFRIRADAHDHESRANPANESGPRLEVRKAKALEAVSWELWGR